MSANRSNIHWHLNNMIAAPAGLAAVKTIYKSEDGILLCYGKTVPDALAGYSQGCIFMHIDGSAGETIYVNEGDDTTSDFNIVCAEDSFLTYLQSHLATQLATEDYGVEAAYPHSGTLAIGPSPLIWDGAPIEEVLMNPGLGFYYFEDFTKLSTYATTVLHDGILFSQNTAEGTAANDPTVPGGILKAACAGTTAAKGPTIQFPGIQCEPLTGTTIRMEWRCQLDTDAGRIFMGLGCDSVIDFVSNDTIITNKNYAGFFRDAGTDTAKKYSCGACDAGGADTDDNVTAEATKTAYHTFGIVMSGIGGVTGSTVEFYMDGVLAYTADTIADLPLLLMCPTFQICGDGGADTPTMSLDWLKVLVHHASGTCREA